LIARLIEAGSRQMLERGAHGCLFQCWSEAHLLGVPEPLVRRLGQHTGYTSESLVADDLHRGDVDDWLQCHVGAATGEDASHDFAGLRSHPAFRARRGPQVESNLSERV
jgi:hypothetical protein